MQKIATSIETQLWYRIIEYLKSENWTVVTEYCQFDKGIDFDSYELKKGNEKILFTWNNWFEGEIKCSKKRMKLINQKFEFKNTYLSTS